MGMLCGNMSRPNRTVSGSARFAVWQYKQQYETVYVAVQTDPAGLSLWQYETVYVAVCGIMSVCVAVQTGLSL